MTRAPTVDYDITTRAIVATGPPPQQLAVLSPDVPGDVGLRLAASWNFLAHLTTGQVVVLANGRTLSEEHN